jgi:hypothetical protein
MRIKSQFKRERDAEAYLKASGWVCQGLNVYAESIWNLPNVPEIGSRRVEKIKAGQWKLVIV